MSVCGLFALHELRLACYHKLYNFVVLQAFIYNLFQVEFGEFPFSLSNADGFLIIHITLEEDDAANGSSPDADGKTLNS